MTERVEVGSGVSSVRGRTDESVSGPYSLLPTPYSLLCVTLWLAYLASVGVLVSKPSRAGMLYPTFVRAGHDFRVGESLYHLPIPEGLDLFRYSPAVAAICSPWEFVPRPVGDILWRAVQALALLAALRMASPLCFPAVPWYFFATAALPLCAGNIHNGQLNPMVLALILFSWVAFRRERFSLAAMAIVAASLIKVYPMALGMMLVLIEPRRFGVRLLIASILGVCVPFCLQEPGYVLDQYREWWLRLGGDDRSLHPLYAGYHDFQKMLRLLGWPIALGSYRAIEMVAGLLLAVVLIRCLRRGDSRESVAFLALNLGLFWMTVFGPATETATYILFSVPAAYGLVSRRETDTPLTRGLFAVGYLLLLSVPVCLWFPSAVSVPVRSLAPQPWGATLVMLGLWNASRTSVRSGREAAATFPASVGAFARRVFRRSPTTSG